MWATPSLTRGEEAWQGGPQQERLPPERLPLQGELIPQQPGSAFLPAIKGW